MTLSDEIFGRNLLALSSIHGQATAEAVRTADPSDRLSVEPARDGSPLPALLGPGGRRLALHSRFGPAEQARKLAGSYTQRGFYVFLGMGAAYEIRAILEAGVVSRGIIVEFDAGYLRALLERVDLTPVLADRRLTLCVSPDERELSRLIGERYVPAVTGDLFTVPLRARVDADPGLFSGALEAVRKAMGAVSDDYSVQAFFGTRWFSNIVRNLELAGSPTPPIGPVRHAIVTAAGPSLEDAFAELERRPGGTFLIATDTSLRALINRGIQPDAVVSIDCQHISYYHFMDGCPPELPVFFDLASPPTVTRLAGRPYFFSSGHPLSRYLTSRFRAFPSLDTSGGNVTHAAVSLADFLGARTITVYGADFSYPQGASYARGTYVFPYFDRRQKRLSPQEALFADFLYRNQNLTRQTDPDGSFRYLTKPLESYHERFERLALNCGAQVARMAGRGVKNLACAVGGGEKPTGPFAVGSTFSSGPLFQSARDFLSSYLAELGAMRPIDAQASAFMDSLSPGERDLWTTLLPAAAAILRSGYGRDACPERVLEETRRWCMSVVAAELENAEPQARFDVSR